MLCSCKPTIVDISRPPSTQPPTTSTPTQTYVTGVLVSGSTLSVKTSDGKTTDLTSMLPTGQVSILNANGTKTLATVLTK